MVNKVILIGNLGQDPELKTFQSGGAICNLSLATSKSYKDKSGEWQQQTQWHRVTVGGPSAQRTAERFRKGDKVFVEGEIQYRDFEGRDGQKKYVTEIFAYTCKMVEDRNKQAQAGQTSDPMPGYGQHQQEQWEDQWDGKVPF